MNRTNLLLVSVVSAAAITGSAGAAVLASTDFDGRTLATSDVSNDTATTLGWALIGLENPGDMAAAEFGVGGQSLFNGTTLTQNSFTPGINTGNGNTSWTTTVDLTVAAGFTVTLSDVTFDYLAVNGGQALNVPRASDFRITLFDPSSVALESVDVADVLGGTEADPQIPQVTAAFASPVALAEPGTYTLEIRGGDFLGDDETGNHTGIDNLSINGTAVPEPSSLLLLGLGFLGLARRRR